jgi:hypothetical protein
MHAIHLGMALGKPGTEHKPCEMYWVIGSEKKARIRGDFSYLKAISTKHLDSAGSPRRFSTVAAK